MKKIVILASGGGTTALAVWKATKPGGLLDGKATVVGLIASKAGIGAIEKLHKAGLATEDSWVVDRRDFPDETSFGEGLLEILQHYEADMFCQYGWLPYTPPNVTKGFSGWAINQHPAGLDPHNRNQLGGIPRDFGGKGMYGRAAVAAQLYFAQKVSRPFFARATAHEVSQVIDGGRVIHWNSLLINTKWSVKRLQRKLLSIEHRTQIEALRFVCEVGMITIPSSAPLIHDDEITKLILARTEAIRDYPNG